MQFKRSKNVFVTTSLHDLEKKTKEVFALDVAGSILVQKYHAESGEAVDIDHYTESFRSLMWKQNLHAVYRYGCESDVLLEYIHLLN